MKIAIAGKGGTGKTTISGTLARWLARADREVVAVDADSNPNLDAILGLARPRTEELRALPTDLRETVEEPDGTRKTVLTRPLPDVIEQYGSRAPDGVRLLVMGRIGHAGDGWMCREHATVRGVLGELMEESRAGVDDVIVDMEAGLEHLSRGTGRHVDLMLAVVEPYYRALETGARVVKLAEELDVGRVTVLANKVRDEEDREAVRDYCESKNLPVLQEIPYDRGLVDAERSGMAPIDHDASAPAVDAVRSLAAHLVAEPLP